MAGNGTGEASLPPAKDPELSLPELERIQFMILISAQSRSGSTCSGLCH